MVQRSERLQDFNAVTGNDQLWQLQLCIVDFFVFFFSPYNSTHPPTSQSFSSVDCKLKKVENIQTVCTHWNWNINKWPYWCMLTNTSFCLFSHTHANMCGEKWHTDYMDWSQTVTHTQIEDHKTPTPVPDMDGWRTLNSYLCPSQLSLIFMYSKKCHYL